MAKINILIPEPQDPYTVDNFRQINQTLETLQNQLNTSYQQDLREESQTFTTFMINTDPSKDRRLADFQNKRSCSHGSYLVENMLNLKEMHNYGYHL
jgi:hypothetical protein